MKTRSLVVACDVCGDSIGWRRAQRAAPAPVDPPPLGINERQQVQAATTAAARLVAIQDIMRERERRRRIIEARDVLAPTPDGDVPWKVAGWYLAPDRDLCPLHAPPPA